MPYLQHLHLQPNFKTCPTFNTSISNQSKHRCPQPFTESFPALTVPHTTRLDSDRHAAEACASSGCSFGPGVSPGSPSRVGGSLVSLGLSIFGGNRLFFCQVSYRITGNPKGTQPFGGTQTQTHLLYVKIQVTMLTLLKVHEMGVYQNDSRNWCLVSWLAL